MERGLTDDPPPKGEWPQDLDVGALLQEGWRPTPLREFVLKVHSRCNLACDYCYMYEMADQGWRRQPRRMARPTVDRVAARIAEHARDNAVGEVAIVLHGGEPLLAGVDHLRYTVERLRAEIAEHSALSVLVQTNGVLVDDAFLRLFDELDVQVGVSLDGAEADNDRHRRRANGRGSYTEVRQGLERLTAPRYRHLFNGLLATIDLQSDPVETYEELLSHTPPGVDFLLPLGNWETLPPDWKPDGSTYGEWLVAVFDRWYRAPVRETRVRMFEEIIRLLMGRPSRSEGVGLSPVALAVVETDGGIEQVDSLKSAFDGAAATTLHTYTSTFDEALYLPAFAARQIGRRALADECLACDIHRVCGGGLFPHRYDPERGFRSPSVYSADLYRLITHIHRTVAADVAALREGAR